MAYHVLNKTMVWSKGRQQGVQSTLVFFPLQRKKTLLKVTQSKIVSLVRLLNRSRKKRRGSCFATLNLGHKPLPQGSRGEITACVIVCPKSLFHFYTKSCHIKIDKTSRAYSIRPELN